ncbi:ABC transporter ATP-binding protein [Metabacillus halosaccharovorans]|uniref:ABC transporter ATP-binding protein n=1 Tax=Metabacillus halosaccharovorans TaxID=930124 RepID=UPI00203BE9E7|nr:ATP-binding cassette domain-containing protein [Metabacillus halosaccharovorans]MCM3444730.1 ATP-binding cassette domain-containing protein [Metabacillus halosaccharovorans]
MNLITITNVSKQYHIKQRGNNFKEGISNFFLNRSKVINAVNDISFSINAGEMVGFIGPNGAGKSTTIKMMTGILYPTTGEVNILGYNPNKYRKIIASKIGVVFGQRSQLWWDLPLIDSFELQKYMYKIPSITFNKNLSFFCDLLDVNNFINTPVRQLSLGQRMRGDLLAALLHDPEVLFLDEPTIGLDFESKEKMRSLLVEINKEKKVTLILTTHDMLDIERTCERMIIIDKGKLVYDGNINEIKEMNGNIKKLKVDFKTNPILNAKAVNFLEEKNGLRFTFSFDANHISTYTLMEMIAKENEVNDFTVEEIEIEKIIKQIYQKSSTTFSRVN